MPQKWDQDPGVGPRTQQPVVGTWGETLCETQGWNSGVGP